MSTYRYETIVTAEQIDVLGHLNNAAYLAIFEAARWAVLGNVSVSWETFVAAGVSPVILDVALHFHREVRLGERLTVESVFVATSPKRFVVRQTMLGADGKVRAAAEMQAAFFDIRARKIVDAPSALLAGLGLTEAEVPAAPTVQGIGGVFLYANDVNALARWYADYLGFSFQNWGESRGLELPSADLVPSRRVSTTTFALFQAENPLPQERTGRVNFRVGDLDGLLTRLETAGCRTERGPANYGRFGWVWDPEGNKIELWEPPKA